MNKKSASREDSSDNELARRYRTKVDVMGNVFERKYNLKKGTYDLDITSKGLQLSFKNNPPLVILREHIKAIRTGDDHIGLELSRTPPSFGGTLCLYTRTLTITDIEMRKILNMESKNGHSKSKPKESKGLPPHCSSCKCREEKVVVKEKHNNNDNKGSKDLQKEKKKKPGNDLPSSSTSSTHSQNRYELELPQLRSTSKVTNNVQNRRASTLWAFERAKQFFTGWKFGNSKRESNPYENDYDEPEVWPPESTPTQSNRWHERTNDATEYEYDIQIPIEIEEDGLHVLVTDTDDTYTVANVNRGPFK